jgi:hypothetical protein
MPKGQRPRRLALNEDRFVRLDEDDCYYAGILATDGCIYAPKEARHLHEQKQITLAMVDLDAIEGLKLFLGASNKIDYKKARNNSKKQARIRVASSTLVDNLERLGITSRKTYTLKVDDRLAKSPDFWRGAIDGDGVIGRYTSKEGYSQSVIELCSASEAFMDQYADYLTSNVQGVKLQRTTRSPENNKSTFKATSNFYKVRVSNKKDVKAILELLYNNNRPALSRKKDKALEIIKLCS